TLPFRVRVADPQLIDNRRSSTAPTLKPADETRYRKRRRIERDFKVLHAVIAAVWIRRGALRFGPVDAVCSHVVVDAFDRGGGSGKKSRPVFGVGGVNLVEIVSDEGLKDVFDVRANGGSVRSIWILSPTLKQNRQHNGLQNHSRTLRPNSHVRRLNPQRRFSD